MATEIDIVRQQRNAALDQIAVLILQLEQLSKENEMLKKNQSQEGQKT